MFSKRSNILFLKDTGSIRFFPKPLCTLLPLLYKYSAGLYRRSLCRFHLFDICCTRFSIICLNNGSITLVDLKLQSFTVKFMKTAFGNYTRLLNVIITLWGKIFIQRQVLHQTFYTKSNDLWCTVHRVVTKLMKSFLHLSYFLQNDLKLQHALFVSYIL